MKQEDIKKIEYVKQLDINMAKAGYKRVEGNFGADIMDKVHYISEKEINGTYPILTKDLCYLHSLNLK